MVTHAVPQEFCWTFPGKRSASAQGYLPDEVEFLRAGMQERQWGLEPR
jgi:hypothetical protein